MKLLIVIMLCFGVVTMVAAEDKPASKKAVTKKQTDEVKELSGISIIGNKEAPKSLYIVPWKDSQVGVESSLTSGLMDERMQPVDKDVFMRELNYYQYSQGKP